MECECSKNESVNLEVRQVENGFELMATIFSSNPENYRLGPCAPPKQRRYVAIDIKGLNKIIETLYAKKGE